MQPIILIIAVADCGQLYVSNANISTPFGTLFGSNATILCDEGYTIMGPSLIECIESGWNDSVLCYIQGKESFLLQHVH